jgi:colanic acid/amylovoran biosynthesis glycosyltransferase
MKVPRRVGFLIPEFPAQTHIAWWRVSEGMREAGVFVRLLSTRRPNSECPHPELLRAAEDTIYLWPPTAADLAAVPALISHVPDLARYLLSLQERRGKERLKLAVIVAASLRLLRVSRKLRLEHIFVHSCADAAHVVAVCHLLGGPAYSLRLGGDLEVYGGDYAAKMGTATLIVPAARAYEPRLVDEVGVAPERVMWSWVGTNTRLFVPGAPVDDGPLRIITVARLNPSKGYHFMLPALARLAENGIDFHYRIVGAGPFESEIRQLISQHGLGKRVELLGQRSSQEIAGYFAESDVFALPTSGLGEGTPAAVCEAMSAGLPIVATQVGGLADMVTPDVHGYLVPPGNSKALADALTQLAKHRALRARFGAASRTKGVEAFDSSAVARRILARIGELTAHSGK